MRAYLLLSLVVVFIFGSCAPRVKREAVVKPVPPPISPEERRAKRPGSDVEELLSQGKVLDAIRLSCKLYGTGLPEHVKRDVISSWHDLGRSEKVASCGDIMCVLGPEDEKEAEAILKETEGYLIADGSYDKALEVLDLFGKIYPKSNLVRYYKKRISFAERGGKFLVASLLPLSGRGTSISDQILESAYSVFGTDREWKLYFLDELKTKDLEGAIKKGTVFVIGPLFSSTIGKLPENTIYLAFTQKAFEKKRGVLRLNLNPEREIDMLLDWAMGRGLRRFAVIYPNTILGCNLKEVFVKGVTERGGSVVGKSPYKQGVSDFWDAIKVIFYPKPKVMCDPGSVSISERSEVAQALGEGEKASIPPSLESVFDLAYVSAPMKYPKFQQDAIGGVDAVFFPDFELPLSLFSSQLYFRRVEGVEIYGVSLSDTPSLLKDIGQPENPVYITGFYPYRREEKIPILKVLSLNLFLALKDTVETSFFSDRDPEKAILSSERFDGPSIGFSVDHGEVYPDIYVLKVGGKGLVKVYPKNPQGSHSDTGRAEEQDRDEL